MSDKFPPWSTGGRLFLSRSQFYLGNVDNTKRHNRDDGTENHLRLWWRRRRQRPLVVCPLACVSQERAASDDGQFSDDVGVSSDATENSVCKNTPDGNKAEVAARKVVKSAPSIRSVRPEHREEPENRQKPTRQKVGRPKGSTNKTAKSKKNHSSLGTSLGSSGSTPNDHSREAANATEAGGNSGGDSANSPYEEKHVGEPCSSLKNSATSSPPRPPASRKDIPQIPPAPTPQAQYQQLSALSAPAHQDTTTSGVDDEAMPSTALTSASRRKYRDRRVQSKATTQSTTAGVNANNEKTPNTGVGDKVGSSSIEQKPGLGKPRDFPPEVDGVTPGLGQGGGHLAGTEGIGTDGNKTNPAAGAKIIANSIMRTRRAFAKTGVSADGQEDEQGKDEVCRGGRGRGENHHKGVASRAMPRRKQLSEDKDTMGEASTELASDDTEKPKAQKRSRPGNGEGGNNSDDDFVLEEKGEDDSAAADVKKQHQRHDEYEHWDLLHQAEAAAILGERLSVRRAIQLPSHHPDRGIATPRADKNPKLPLPTFSGEARTTDDEDEQQVDRVDDGGDSEHFGSDKFFPPPPNANPLEAEVMATIIPGVGDDFDDDGGIDPSYGVIPDDVELVPPGSATTTTAPMPSAMGSAVAGDRVSVEGGSSVAVWSLKERLGMSDEEVQALRASNRSGLADSDLLVEQKLTGAESGGPTTALGYLLENLRMKPWEVRG